MKAKLIIQLCKVDIDAGLCNMVDSNRELIPLKRNFTFDSSFTDTKHMKYFANIIEMQIDSESRYRSFPILDSEDNIHIFTKDDRLYGVVSVINNDYDVIIEKEFMKTENLPVHILNIEGKVEEFAK